METSKTKMGRGAQARRRSARSSVRQSTRSRTEADPESGSNYNDSDDEAENQEDETAGEEIIESAESSADEIRRRAISNSPPEASVPDETEETARQKRNREAADELQRQKEYTSKQ